MDVTLETAIKIENIKYIEDYIDKHGVDSLNIKDKNGWAPLQYAAYYGRLEIVKLLINNGADINIKNDGDRTPLYLAVYWNQIETTKYLISKGADINVKTNEGWTPLHNAVYVGHFMMVKLLLTHGANREIRDKKERRPIDLTKNKEIITLLEGWQDLLEIKEPDV